MQQTINSATQTVDVEVERKSQQLLVKLLESGDEAQRCYSARAVADSHCEAAISALNQNLYHHDPDVVVDASHALATLSGGDIESLIDVAQHHPEGDARLAALDALANQISRHDVEIVFTDIALGRDAGDQWGISSDWDDWWDIQLKAVQVLVSQPKHHFLDVYHQVLEQDPEPELEAVLYQGIAQLDPSWITDQLVHSPLMTKRKLLKSLRFSNAQIAKAFLFRHLNDEDALVRRIALEALADKEAYEYFWDMARLLQDDDSAVQNSALMALERLSSYDVLDKKRLHGYLKCAPEKARAQIIQLMEGMNLEQSDYPSLLEFAQYPDSLIALMRHCRSGKVPTDVQQQIVIRVRNALQKPSLETHVQLQLIRALDQIENYIDLIFPLLEKRVAEVDEQTQQAKYCASVRQASFDIVSHHAIPACQHLLRTTLFGLDAYPDSIAVETASDTDPNEAELLAVLEQHQVPVQVENENQPTSTLGAISQSNLQAKLVPMQTIDDQQGHIVDMVDELDEEYQEFAQAVKSNFDSADKLDLNRKKIARLPEFDNKILALRSLGQSRHPDAIEWLVEAILGASEAEMVEIFQSLARQKRSHPKAKSADNGIGAVGKVLFSGQELTQQSAVKFLIYVPASKAVPLLIEACASRHEHVRLCALFSLEPHLNKVPALLKPQVEQVVKQALNDQANGVRKQALKLACLMRQNWQVELGISLSSLVELALDDDECHSVAFERFPCEKSQVLNWLHEHWSSLSPQQQPNAIRLFGALL